MLLVAASFFSYYTVAAKPLIERLGGVVVMTYAALFGSAAGRARSACRRAWPSTGARSRPAIWAGTFYAVIVSAFLGWLVWGWVNAVRGVARTAPLMYLMPPVAGLVAWALTGEHYSAIKLDRRRDHAGRRRAGAVHLVAARSGARGPGAGRLNGRMMAA